MSPTRRYDAATVELVRFRVAPERTDLLLEAIDKAIEQGLVDELYLHLAPLLLGGGTPLFRAGTRQRYRQGDVGPSSNPVPPHLRAADQRRTVDRDGRHSFAVRTAAASAGLRAGCRARPRQRLRGGRAGAAPVADGGHRLLLGEPDAGGEHRLEPSAPSAWRTWASCSGRTGRLGPTGLTRFSCNTRIVL
jgi:hypothetical protein